MTDRVAEAMQEVWAWKRKAEEATSGMDSGRLIDFYHHQAEETERKMGLHLRNRNAADVAQPGAEEGKPSR